MNYKKFFDLAASKNITESELSLIQSDSISFSLFHGEIDNYEISSSTAYFARGIYNGKFGSCASDSYNQNKAIKLVDEIVNNAKTIEKNEPALIFKGSSKYKKVHTFNKNLSSIDATKKIDLLYQLEKKIKEYDSRISEVASVYYTESSSTYKINNSHGLKLSQKLNVFALGGEAVAKDGDKTKTGDYSIIGNDFDKIDIPNLAKQIAINALEQLNGEPCKSGKYKAILSNEVVSTLTSVLISYASSEKVQKQTSLFIGKLNNQVASKKVTIMDAPISRSLYARSFDDEGVATYNKPIIEKGVLKTYLYNLRTAEKDGVTTTANGYGGGSKMGVSPSYILFKPGRKTLEDLFKQIDTGVYITSVEGVHSGLNPQSGDFSLQAQGFMIENGVKTHALDVITISSNILDIFKNITFVGSDLREFFGGISVPSVAIKSIMVVGK